MKRLTETERAAAARKSAREWQQRQREVKRLCRDLDRLVTDAEELPIGDSERVVKLAKADKLLREIKRLEEPRRPVLKPK